MNCNTFDYFINLILFADVNVNYTIPPFDCDCINKQSIDNIKHSL